MRETYRNFTLNEQGKALILQEKTLELGIDLADCEIGVNQSNGNTYIWSEDYPFTLFIGLYSDTIYVLYTDFETGEETEEELNSFDSLGAIYSWIENIEESQYAS